MDQMLNLDERQKFVEQSQKERRDREVNRQRSQFVTEFNAVARGFLLRSKFYGERRTEFIAHFGNVNGAFTNTELLRQGSFVFYNIIKRKGDEQLLELLIKTLLRSIESPSTATSFAALFLSAQHIQTTTRFITDLFRFLPAQLAACKLQTNFSVKTATLFIKFLDRFASCQTWPLISGKSQILKILDGLCAKFSAPLYENSCFGALAAALSNGLKGRKTALPKEIINELFAIIFKVLSQHTWNDESIVRFIRYVLSAPALIVALNGTSLGLMRSENIFQRTLLIIVTQKDQIFQSSGILTLNLTANFIHLSYLEQQALIENLHDWTVAVNTTLSKCQSSANSGVPHGFNNYYNPILGWSGEKIDDETHETFERVGGQLEYLWSRKLINCLFGQVLSCFELPSNSKAQKESKNSEEGLLPTELVQKLLKRLALKEHETVGSKEQRPNVAAVVCQLYQQVLLLFNDYKMSILNSICFDDRILAQLWNFVVDSNFGGLENYVRLLAIDPLVTSANFAPLHLFADAAQSLIQILDEKEMYESGSPFSITTLRNIARFTNLFCFKCIWDGLIDFEQMRPKALFQSVYKLNVILYTRDCRRSFTMNPNFWIVHEIKPNHVITEFERGQQRAKQLLQHIPHVIPLRDRMILFRKLITREKDHQQGNSTVITVERSRVVEDSYRQLAMLPVRALRSTIRVKFINQQGLDEAGIDQDGVFKEFLEITLKKVFDPELNLFKSTSNNLLYPSNTSYIQENHLDYFKFVGRMLGKAVYEGICIDVQLAPVLLAALLKKKFCPFDELSTLDPELYRNLTFVKHYNEDVADLELNFAFSEDSLGKIQTVELKPGGSNIRVTNENKISYIHQMAQFRVVGQTADQCKYFVQGFQSIISNQWLSLFSTHELQFVISGQTSDIDIEDLRKHCQYYGGFHSNHRVIKWLWQILEHEFSSEERHLFLKFGTSCSRPPLLGFAYLEPAFSIRCVETSDDMDQGDTLGSVIRGFLAIKRKQPMTRLPTAATCFNLLKLPNYSKKSILLEKLRTAIHSESGFELS
ncbi:HECT-type E3 ubiquitin transferase [Aphelenchoides besseyi]|nr:HECT-type E3 ubiquitin transferase [Aphelenchoides besseyi]